MDNIKAMRESLAGFNSFVAATREKIEKNNRIFVKDEAEKANAALLAQIDNERKAAREKIEAARAKGVSAAGAWGKIDGSQITEDAKLLEYGTLSPDQFKSLAEKYKDNATMSDLLLKYAKEKSTGAFTAAWNFTGKEKAKPTYDTSMLRTGEQKAAAYDRAADQALTILKQIGNYDPRYMATSPGFIDLSIEQFGQNFEF